jgi:hypothetical protein
MLGNDIREHHDIGQGVIFEGLLATPPAARLFKWGQSKEWEKELRRWKPNDLPLKALIDTYDRLGISTEVYTLLGDDAAEHVENWLLRKGISLAVYGYSSIEELAYDLRFKRSMRTIYVPEQEQAAIIGLRAQVVDPRKAWTV